MTGRNYDVTLIVSNAASFEATNTVIGANSSATGVLANVDIAANVLKVKLNNVLVEFQTGEAVLSNITLTTGENLFVTYFNDQDTLTDSNGFFIDGNAQVFAIPETSNTEIFKDHINIFSNGNVYVTQSQYIFPSTSNTISDKEFANANASVTTKGNNYVLGDIVTLVGGTARAGLKTNLQVDNVSAISAVRVVAGTGYLPQDNITFLGGITHISNAKATINVVRTVTTDISAAGTGYTVNDVVNLIGGVSTAQAIVNVTAVGGSGEVTAIIINTIGAYTTVASNAITTVNGTGTGLTVNADYGVTAVTINNAGDYSTIPVNPVAVTGDGGDDATFTLSYGVNAISIVNAGQYVVVPSNPEPISTSGGSGIGFTVTGFFSLIIRLLLRRGITFNFPIASTVSNLLIQVVRGDHDHGKNQMPEAPSEEETTGNTTIISLAPSPFIAEKNAFEQKPLVRLYTIFYPGEWFPANEKGNPTGEGAGLSWPLDFPFRFAEVRGEVISDIQYSVLFGGIEFTPYPIDSSGITIDSSGKINEVNLTISNFDNVITTLVENPFLVGNNTANAQSATVNEEIVGNIDPRTIPGNPLFDNDVADARGGLNLAFDVLSTAEVAGTWIRGKQDTRDLLGAVVEIRSTFANFLDVWPEYSTVRGTFGNGIEMFTTLPYRIGDTITGNNTTANSIITNIRGQFLITNNSQFSGEIVIGDRIYIENTEADSESFVLDTFKVNSLEAMNDTVASFGLTSWLQFFKLQLPKRRFFKNTCAWVYKGDECQYPDDGTGQIVGDQSKTANGFFDINNSTVTNLVEDVCARNLVACNLRRNGIHFGGWPGTGRTIPR